MPRIKDIKKVLVIGSVLLSLDRQRSLTTQVHKACRSFKRRRSGSSSAEL